MDWIMVIFMFVLAAHFAGWISEKNAKRIGWLSLGPGLLTFFVNLLGVLLGSFILAIPVPIPAIAGLLILHSYPCELISPWPELDDGPE
jgi:hypothetical protein